MSKGNNKKVIIIAVIIIVLVLVFTLGKSYAYFETSIAGSNITFGVGKLLHSLNGNIKLDAGESRIIDLIVKSNDEVDSKYQVYYKSDDDLTDVLVGYSDNADLPSGEIEARGRKNISVILVNNSSNEVSIEIGVRGGLVNNSVEDIILEEGENRLVNLIDKESSQIKSSSELYAFYKGSFSATATTNDVLTGKTVYINGQEITGTMPNNGAVSKTITPSTSAQTYTIPEGYHNGNGTIIIDPSTGDGYEVRIGTASVTLGNYETGSLAVTFSEPMSVVPTRIGIDVAGSSIRSVSLGGYSKTGFTFTGRNGNNASLSLTFTYVAVGKIS